MMQANATKLMGDRRARGWKQLEGIGGFRTWCVLTSNAKRAHMPISDDDHDALGAIAMKEGAILPCSGGCGSELQALDEAATGDAVKRAVKAWERGKFQSFSSAQEVEDAMKSLIADTDLDCPNRCD